MTPVSFIWDSRLWYNKQRMRDEVPRKLCLKKDLRKLAGNNKSYIAIDLKSFYASVECIERGLNPLTTNLVVADASRTEKTICLAVSPSLKRHGIPGRPRLFEVVQKVRAANQMRQKKPPAVNSLIKLLMMQF